MNEEYFDQHKDKFTFLNDLLLSTSADAESIIVNLMKEYKLSRNQAKEIISEWADSWLDVVN